MHKLAGELLDIMLPEVNCFYRSMMIKIAGINFFDFYYG